MDRGIDGIDGIEGKRDRWDRRIEGKGIEG
jgi:hypothetical protein